MPGFDRTGPMGQGSMTGGARGHCNPGYAGNAPAYGRGYSAGRGRGSRKGFGRGRSYGSGGAYGRWEGPSDGPYYTVPYSMSSEQEMNMLKNDAEMIKAELDAINKRLAELESDSAQ